MNSLIRSYKVYRALERLQDLQTEIYLQLQLLIPDQVANYDSFRSQVSGSPVLRMDLLERHPYTHFLRLTYQFKDKEQSELAPDAHIRIYNDARLAEVTSFNHEQGFKRPAYDQCNSVGRATTALVQNAPPNLLFQRCWRQNRALDKWLAYLLQQGHSICSMQPTAKPINGKPVLPITAIIR